MMKTILFFFLAVVAIAHAGLVGQGPEVFSAVSTKQVHHPWATSSSSRVQHFNHYAVVAPVAHVAAPVAHVAHVAAPVAHVASVAHVAPVAHAASYGLGFGHGYGHGYGHGFGYGHGLGYGLYH